METLENKVDRLNRKMTTLGWLIGTLLIGIPAMLFWIFPKLDWYHKLKIENKEGLTLSEKVDVFMPTLISAILITIVISLIMDLIKKDSIISFTKEFFFYKKMPFIFLGSMVIIVLMFKYTFNTSIFYSSIILIQSIPAIFTFKYIVELLFEKIDERRGLKTN